MLKLFREIIMVSIILVFITGCQSEKQSDVNYKFNPPSWIIGTWIGPTQEFAFTDNNIIKNKTVDFNDKFKNNVITEHHRTDITGYVSYYELNIIGDTHYIFSKVTEENSINETIVNEKGEVIFYENNLVKQQLD